MKKSLIYKTSRTKGNINVFVKIRLDDECNNGHQDFAITASVYEAGKPTTDRNMISCGRCHDDILKVFPEFKIFVDLHLCDWEGVPMYAAGNGFYNLKTGLGNTKPDADNFEAEFCEHYRVSKDQFARLRTAENELQFAVMLQDLGILKQWKEEANKAIKLLESLTGETFEPASVKSNFTPPTPEALEEEKQKQASGYYTEEAKAARDEAKAQEEFTKAEKKAERAIAAIELELLVKKRILKVGGKHFLDNCIFYNHTKEIGLNWRGYGDQLTEKEIRKLKQEIVLPAGVDFAKGV